MAAKRGAAAAGDTYTYSGEEPIGVDAGALTPGTTVTVRETVAAGDPGAHDDSEDCVVIEWEAPALVQGENGVEVGSAPRAMSISTEQFNDMFTKGG